MLRLRGLIGNHDLGLLLLRLGAGIVFIVFGIDKFLDPIGWASWAPPWFWSLMPLAETPLMYIVGVTETLLGALMLIGLWTRLAAALTAAHLASIIILIGMNEIAVRDIGLLFLALGIAVLGAGAWSLDAKNS